MSNKIKHIVFIQIIDDNSENKSIAISELENRLNSLPANIKEIISLEVGRNISSRSSFDLSLTVVLDSEDDLNIYRNHPKHVEVLDFMKTLQLKTAVVDYFF